MNLELSHDHPLAKAIVDSPFSGDTWLILRTPTSTPYQSYRSEFRANVTKWTLDGETLRVELESWEDHMDRRAQLLGL